MDQWHVARGKVKEGPYSRAQLQALAGKGLLRASDMLLQQGAKGWVPAGQVPGLLPAEPRPVMSAERGVAAAQPAPAPTLLAASPAPLPVASPCAADGPRSRPWLWIGAGSMGLCTLGIVTVLLVWGFSGRSKNGEPVAQSGGKSTPGDAADDPWTGISSSSVSADYIRLASLITDPYSLEKAKFLDASPLNKVGDMDAALDSVNETRDAALRPAVDKLMAASGRRKEIVKSFNESAKRADECPRRIRVRSRGATGREPPSRRFRGLRDRPAPRRWWVRRVHGLGPGSHGHEGQPTDGDGHSNS